MNRDGMTYDSQHHVYIDKEGGVWRRRIHSDGSTKHYVQATWLEHAQSYVTFPGAELRQPNP